MSIIKQSVFALGIAALSIVGWQTLGPSSTPSSSSDGERADGLRQARGRIARPARANRAVRPSSGDRGNAVEALDSAPAATEAGPGDREDSQQSASAPTEFDATLAQAFADDSSSSEWTREAQERIEQLASEALPEGSSLRNVDCKSSLCKVEINHSEADGHQELMQTLMRSRNGWDGPGVYNLVRDDDGSEMTLAYLGPAHAEDDPNSVWASPVGP